MKPIVLATDGSPSAAEATLSAVELAKALGAPLVAVSVEHVLVPAYGYFGYSDVVAELTKMERAHVRGTLEQTRTIAAEAGLACETVPCSGPVSDAICRTAREVDARLIVVGARGWGPIGRALHGSVSTAVLHEAHCPVLVVRGGPEVVTEAALAETGQAA